MAESARLLVPAVSTPFYLAAFGVICAGGQIFLHHTCYVAVLKWLTLSLFSYFATPMVVHVSWYDFLQGTLVAAVGMGISNAVALAIMATAATAFHAKGIWQLDSAAQTAEALRPIAGQFAFAIFCPGNYRHRTACRSSAGRIRGICSRGGQTLAGRTFPKPFEAKAFYGTIAAATAVGALANAFHIGPLKALVWSAAVNAIAARPR